MWLWDVFALNGCSKLFSQDVFFSLHTAESTRRSNQTFLFVVTHTCMRCISNLIFYPYTTDGMNIHLNPLTSRESHACRWQMALHVAGTVNGCWHCGLSLNLVVTDWKELIKNNELSGFWSVSDLLAAELHYGEYICQGDFDKKR